MPEASSRILKAHAARELPAQVAFNFEDLREQAAAELARARAEADAIRQRAEAEVAAMKQQVFDAAQREGLAAGQKQAQQLIDEQARKLTDQQMTRHLKTTIPAIEQAAALLQGERDQWLLRWEEAAIQLGVAIAEKLVKVQIQVNPELATGMVGEALQLAVGQTRLHVRLHPADLEHLGEHAESFVRAFSGCDAVTLIGDAAVGSGGCRIETQFGEIDARLETMLERIAAELLAT